jgi:hypothetical protein
MPSDAERTGAWRHDHQRPRLYALLIRRLDALFRNRNEIHREVTVSIRSVRCHCDADVTIS